MSKYRMAVYDREGALIAEPTAFTVKTYLGGANGGTFSPYDHRAMRLVVLDENGQRLASYNAMTPEEFHQWELREGWGLPDRLGGVT